MVHRELIAINNSSEQHGWLPFPFECVVKRWGRACLKSCRWYRMASGDASTGLNILIYPLLRWVCDRPHTKQDFWAGLFGPSTTPALSPCGLKSPLNCPQTPSVCSPAVYSTPLYIPSLAFQSILQIFWQIIITRIIQKQGFRRLLHVTCLTDGSRSYHYAIVDRVYQERKHCCCFSCIKVTSWQYFSSTIHSNSIRKVFSVV